MRQIHGKRFRTKDRLEYVEHINAQCIEQIKLAIEALEDCTNKNDSFHEVDKYVNGYNTFINNDDLNQLQLSEAGIKAKEFLLEVSEPILNDDIVSAIKCLWMEPAIKKIYDMRNITEIEDSSAYFWNELDRINDDDYVPNITDLLLVRYRTLGLVKYIIFNSK